MHIVNASHFETGRRRLGASELTVPALGVGTWSWGDTLMWGYGRSHTGDDVGEAYRASLDAGLGFFDTAEVYGRGESERLLGRCSREAGRPVTVATKFAPLPARRSAATLERALDGSLRRLGVERIDLYQIHGPSPLPFLQVDALMDAMAGAVRAGKVRAVGVSNYSASLMRRAHARLAGHGIPLASNQVHHSLLHRYPETNGVLDACRELDVALIAYSPLEQGVLTGKYRTGAASMPRVRRLAAGFLDRVDPFGETGGSVARFRRLLSGSGKLRTERLAPVFHALEEAARAHGKTIGQVALNWLVHVDPCVVAIPGAKNARQARENAGALGWRLSDAEHARIGEAAAG